MSIRIQDAELCHIDGIEAIEQTCFSMPWSRDQLVRSLPDEDHIMLAALNDDGAVMGYVGLMSVLDEGYIANVAVAEEFRRCGVGAALIDALIKRSRERELAFITLEVRESNAAARGLYRKFGFIDVGRRKNYYFKPTEDAILMTLFLK